MNHKSSDQGPTTCPESPGLKAVLNRGPDCRNADSDYRMYLQRTLRGTIPFPVAHPGLCLFLSAELVGGLQLRYTERPSKYTTGR